MGWYYQQFLKYELVLKSKYRYVLVIDGDSFFDFRAKNLRNVVYVTDKNVNKRYLNFVSGELCIPALQKNAITNQMLFDKILLKSMISFIEFDSCEMNYIDVIHAKIISSKGRFLFSEYQTYASWCVSKRKYPISKIKVFRRIDLLYSLDSFSVMEALRSYFLVAYEPGHRSGCLRKIRAFIYYKLKLNLG
jgi:hypothetical protein